MLFGEMLFVLAVLSVAGATSVGIVVGVLRLILFKIQGRDLRPRSLPGSDAWLAEPMSPHVDTSRKSLLTERVARTSRDPLVRVGDGRYRVTRLGASRYLVTEVEESRRVGTFDLDGSGREQEVIPEPEEPANARLLVQVAVLASLSRRNAA